LQLNKTGLLNFLNIVPSEKNIIIHGTEPVIEITHARMEEERGFVFGKVQ
jgi:hypothetical protein